MGKLGEWSFCFLAQLPEVIDGKPCECEISYQAAMFRQFAYIGISHIRASSEVAVQAAASKALATMIGDPTMLNGVMPNVATMASQLFVDEWLTGQIPARA